MGSSTSLEASSMTPVAGVATASLELLHSLVRTDEEVGVNDNADKTEAMRCFREEPAPAREDGNGPEGRLI